MSVHDHWKFLLPPEPSLTKRWEFWGWIAFAALVASLVTLFATAAHAATCHSRPGDDGNWTWRTIDGRKCWYAGRHVIAKSNLQWPAGSATTARQLSEPKAAAAAPVPKHTAAADPSMVERAAPTAPPAQIAFPTLVVAKEMPGPALPLQRIDWLSPWSMMGSPLLWDIDEPERFIAWRKRIQ